MKQTRRSLYAKDRVPKFDAISPEEQQHTGSPRYPYDIMTYPPLDITSDEYSNIPTSFTMVNTIPTRIYTPSNIKDVTYNIPVGITTRQNTLQRKFPGQTQHVYKSIPYNCIKVKTVQSPANPSSVCPTFFLSNICHISNKIDELSGIVSVKNPSLIMKHGYQKIYRIRQLKSGIIMKYSDLIKTT